MIRRKQEVVAMILAGGKGSRLGNLTKQLAKPAVPFGGKYRIIDFTLSNCSNSGIYTVGVLTQYQPLVLNSYIGIGNHWDLDRKSGGVTILPPYVTGEGGRWYKGTANAIYENIDFVDLYNPEYVLVLSGDHIYKMDYSKMIAYHKEKKADATISVMQVPWQEASRFGIMNTKQDNRIFEFDEKPKEPKNNLASMGIYIFNWKTLKNFLLEDENDPKSSNDFGKDVIPKMLNSNLKMFAYSFKDYWRDVGTIRSLWEANMDLLKEDNQLNLYDRNWKIYTVNPISPPHFVSDTSVVKNSLLNEGCMIYGELENSIIFPDVHIGKQVKIKDSIIMAGARIENDVVIEKSIVESGVHLKGKIKIGDSNKDEITLITSEGVFTYK